jgi:hypothetical protein
MRIDWYPPYPHEKVTSIAKQLYSHLLVKSQGANKSDREQKLFRVCLQFISALYLNHHSINKASSVSTYKSPKHFSSNESDKGKINYPARAFLEVHRALLQLGWITETLGVKGKSLTLIEPTPILKGMFDDIGFVWAKQPLKGDENLLLMRNVKRDEKNKKIKFDVPLPDYNDKELHLENLRKINSALVNHCITLDLNDADLFRVNTRNKDDNNETDIVDKSLLITNVQLSRIFARGSVKHGGRFYRGWWQSLPWLHRPHIRVNGYKTDEVDFNGIGIRILYAIKGMSYNEDDPYDIGLNGWQGKSDPRRKHIKKALNALINDVDKGYKLDKHQISSLGMDTNEFKRLVNKKHKPIKELFQSMAGLEAQYIDSQIAEQVMLTLIDNDSIALPIHDSFIVRVGHKGLLLDAMEKACRDIIGVNISTTDEYIKNAEHFNLNKDSVLLQSNDIDNMIADLNALKEVAINYPSTIMDKYLVSFEGFKAKESTH